MECESMFVDDQTSESYHYYDKNLYSENDQSTPSSSYLPDNSYQESTGDSEYQAEEIQVNCPKHLSLPENGSKNMKTEPRSNLNASRKRKYHFESNEYVPLAEQVWTFQRKTPNRFHTTGKTREHWSPKLVCAKSPNLQAVKRRCVNVLSREQEEMKRYKFHAQPVIYDKLSHVPLPNVVKKLPTTPKGLHLKTAQRAAEMNAKKKEEEQRYEFHARPVPKVILNGPTGLKEKPAVYVTEPKTPNFALKSREEKWKSRNKLLKLSGQTCSSFKAKPATLLQKPPFVPEKPLKLPLATIDVHLPTEVRAAVHQELKEKMDTNEQEKVRRLQEMKQLQKEKERHEILKIRKQLVFKANPVRHFKPFEIKPTDKALTEPVSPKFRSDERMSRFLEIRIHF